MHLALSGGQSKWAVQSNGNQKKYQGELYWQYGIYFIPSSLIQDDKRNHLPSIRRRRNTSWPFSRAFSSICNIQPKKRTLGRQTFEDFAFGGYRNFQEKKLAERETTNKERDFP